MDEHLIASILEHRVPSAGVHAHIPGLVWALCSPDERVQAHPRVYKPTKFAKGMQPGTVESELNRRRLRKERREDDRQRAKIQATRLECERESRSKWWPLGHFFQRFWSK